MSEQRPWHVVKVPYSEGSDRYTTFRVRATDNGTVDVSVRNYIAPMDPPDTPEWREAEVYAAEKFAASFGRLAPNIAREVGASDEYRVAVLKACINSVMQSRGARRVRTFVSASPYGMPWEADIEAEDSKCGAKARGNTEVEVLEALARFLGAAR